MVRFLFHILFFLMGFTLTLGIMGGVLCSLQKHSSKLLQIIGESKIFDSKLLYNPEWPFILIPEFNFEFLGGDKTTEAYREFQNHKLTLREIFWWSRWDSEVRVKAFDRLIGIYKAKS